MSTNIYGDPLIDEVCAIEAIQSYYEDNIHESGPNKSFVVSLYGVNESYNEEILNWFEGVRIVKDHSGLSMLPKRFKLDSVTLTLQDM